MKKLNKKFIFKIMTILLFMLMVAALVSYAYIGTDFFKTTKELFGKYLFNNIEQLGKFNTKPYDKIFKDLSNKNSEIKLSIDYIIDSEEATSLIEENNKLATIATIKNDIENQRSSMDLDMNIDEVDFLDISMLSSKSKLGIKTEGLYDKYLTIENRELKRFFEKLGIDENKLENIPNKIEIPETKEFTEEELIKVKELTKKYVKKLSEAFEDTTFSKEKSIEIDFDDKKIITDKYMLTVNEREFLTSVTNIMSELLTDQEFLILYKGVISDEQIKDLTEYNDELISKIKNINEESKVSIVVYVKDKSTVRTDYISDKMQITYEIINEEEINSIKISINKEKENEISIGQTTIFKITNEATDKGGEISYETALSYNANDIEKLNKEMEEFYGYKDYYTDTYKNRSVKYTFISEVQDENSSSIILKTEDDSNAKIKIDINLKNDINIQELTDENSEIVNDYSTLQLQKLGVDMSSNAYKFSKTNPKSLIGIVYNFISSFANIETNILK